ncbi:MAG TPA: hypothetical protein VM100_08730 [Longimicrobiales bacterium]|nr:hypothetical protein [Longimicrobiales bacterium]
MAHKLAVYCERAGVESDRIVDAYHAATAHRLPILKDVFHKEALHPARTALILLEDTSCRDANVLCAAVLTDTEYPDLRLSAQVIGKNFGSDVRDLVQQVPTPDGRPSDGLLEELVGLPDDVVMIAVAERLDHARHLRFRESTYWRDFYDQAVTVYAPVAGRVSERLQQRWTRWASAFTFCHTE